MLFLVYICQSYTLRLTKTGEQFNKIYFFIMLERLSEYIGTSPTIIQVRKSGARKIGSFNAGAPLHQAEGPLFFSISPTGKGISLRIDNSIIQLI